MGPHVSTIFALALAATAACGGTARHQAAAPAAPDPAAAAQLHAGLNIRLTTVYVDDQERALHFYTDVLGFEVKDDVENGGYRWLTVTAPADPAGAELQLALASDPAARAYQQAMFQQGQPALMFYSADVRADHARIAARGGAFTMPPTELMAGSVITTLPDTCGNLIQITELAR